MRHRLRVGRSTEYRGRPWLGRQEGQREAAGVPGRLPSQVFPPQDKRGPPRQVGTECTEPCPLARPKLPRIHAWSPDPSPRHGSRGPRRGQHSPSPQRPSSSRPRCPPLVQAGGTDSCPPRGARTGPREGVGRAALRSESCLLPSSSPSATHLRGTSRRAVLGWKGGGSLSTQTKAGGGVSGHCSAP